MTWGIGANDVANAMGTSVGSGAISVKQAIIIAAIFEFSGAFLAGGHVTKTIRKSIIDPTPIMGNPEILVYGMLSALIAAALWLTIASWMGWPVSTTHSIIGAIVGFAIVGIGVDAVNWSKIGTIVLSWIVSPLVGGTIAFLLMRSIQRFSLDTDIPFLNAKRYAPFYVFLVGFLISLVTLFKGLKHLDIELSIVQSFIFAVIFGVFVAVIAHIIINRISMKLGKSIHDQFNQIENIFGIMMILTASAMAFAHGSNDVANGKGNYGYNAATNEYGDLVEMGIIDPTKVTRFALQNAASVTGLLLTTEAMVAEAPQDDVPAAPMPDMGGMGGMGGMM